MNVCLMLKAPRGGFVKTRLARDIGGIDAVKAYRRLVETQIASLPENWVVHIAFTPNDAGDEMREWLGADYHYFAQCDGDLGARLVHSARCLDVPLIFLGGDCPALNRARLLDAAESMKSADIVIWPAEDGGYCLLGFQTLIPEIFTGITWGTDKVFNETLERIPVGVSLCVMTPPLEDVDDLASWERALATGCMQKPPELGST